MTIRYTPLLRSVADYQGLIMSSFTVQYWRDQLADPLYKNSLFIFLTNITNAGFGLIFWFLAARLFLEEDVGIATALISSMAFLLLLTQFGLDYSIVRFFPGGDKEKIFSTSVIIAVGAVLIFGFIFVVGIDIWAPELKFIQDFLILFIVVACANSIVSLSGISFVALRKAEFYLFQTLIMGSRVLFLVPLISFGAIGIFSSVGLSLILALIYSLFVLRRFKMRPRGIDREFLRASFNFSAGNYVAGLLGITPNLILPIMVLNILGPSDAAHYYIAFSMASLLFIIPSAFSTSLFVEGSHGESLRNATIKSMAAILALLTPAVVMVYLFGNFFLGLLGAKYTAGFELLKIFAISSYFIAIFSIYCSIKVVQKDLKSVIFIKALSFLIIIGSGFVLLENIGLMGIGYAWTLGYILISGVILIVFLTGKMKY